MPSRLAVFFLSLALVLGPGLLSLVAAGGLPAAGAGGRTPAERARIAAVTRPTADFSGPERYELRPGGAATVFATLNQDSFSHPSANMTFRRELDFKVGNAIFRKFWVSSPSSTTSSDGLGPLFNSRSCQSCHLKDGRGHPPVPGEAAVSLFLRLSVPPQNAADRKALAERRIRFVPEPTYGEQLQTFSVQGLRAEGRMTLSYEPVPVTLADGTVVELHRPRYGIAEPAYGPLHPNLMISPRLAPPMIGVGLLEAIPAEDILAGADPEDADGDGISGRANAVWSDEERRVVLGRFGWKAGQPSIAQQTASAFLGDIGIATPLYPRPAGDCSGRQPDCLEAPSGAESAAFPVEATPEMVEKVDFYSRNLGVPARRDIDDPQVLAGKRVFYRAGCIGCHRPKFVTRRDSIGAEQSFQLIWPYSDLLLHDLGEGLADGRPEGLAGGREWRTPPLWGIGLTERVNGPGHYLHDGRARSLLEAILWHGGEAEAAKQRVVALPAAERAALLAFLKSL
ncbi:di-heme oxidoreductase family protein [Tistlia consotensis]|nr:di-heme oxidoredictase family protein [Tistlia consotensis]